MIIGKSGFNYELQVKTTDDDLVIEDSPGDQIFIDREQAAKLIVILQKFIDGEVIE